VLEHTEQVDAVRERLTGAGIEPEEGDTGFVARDPWENAVAFAAG